MSIYRLPNSPFYYYDFQLKGKRHNGSTKCQERKAALAFEAQVRSRLAVAVGINTLTLSRACDKYWEEKGIVAASHGTIQYQLERLKEGFGANTPLIAIRNSDISEYVNTTKKRPTKNGIPLSAASINRELQLLRRIFIRADKVWEVDVGRDRNWRDLLLKEPPGRERELTIDEQARLLATIRPDLIPLVVFALLSGLRKGNLVGLMWKQIDLTTNTIKLRMKGNRLHTIPISSQMRLLLEYVREDHPLFVFTYKCHKKRGARLEGERHPFTIDGWGREWRTCLKEAGIEDYRFHDNRHTAATRLVRETHNLKLAQTLLGHTSIMTTARYAHANLTDLSNGLEQLSQPLPELPTK